MAIPLQSDYDAEQVLSAAKPSKDAAQVRRMLACAAIYDGARRTAAARIRGESVVVACGSGEPVVAASINADGVPRVTGLWSAILADTGVTR